MAMCTVLSKATLEKVKDSIVNAILGGAALIFARTSFKERQWLLLMHMVHIRCDVLMSFLASLMWNCHARQNVRVT